MSRKIIAFLGKYPKETRYAFQGKVYTGNVFPEALYQFVDFDQMLVFVTDEAREHAWPVLEALGDERIQPVTIARGETTAEMWAMFDEMLVRVEENDTVIFDITHGLRSAPFLVFLFAAFLKIARNVTIEAVYYGAFELGNPKENIPAPVIDLTEFVTMLDWLTATSRFVEGGDGHALAGLLRNEIPPGIQMGTDLDARQLGNQLKGAAGAIEDISKALRVVRPIEAMQSAHLLTQTLKKTQAQVSQEARPFELLANKMVQEYGQFQLDNPVDKLNIRENLKQQIAMIRWYLDHQHIVQAVLLAREWIVSLLSFLFGENILDEQHGRKVAENALYQADKQSQKKGSLDPKILDDNLKRIPNAVEIVKLWQRLTKVRNDIAHCGMRMTAKEAKRLIQDADDFYPELEMVANTLLIDHGEQRP